MRHPAIHETPCHTWDTQLYMRHCHIRYTLPYMRHQAIHETCSHKWDTLPYMRHPAIHDTHCYTCDTLPYMRHPAIHETPCHTWDTLPYMIKKIACALDDIIYILDIKYLWISITILTPTIHPMYTKGGHSVSSHTNARVSCILWSPWQEQVQSGTQWTVNCDYRPSLNCIISNTKLWHWESQLQTHAIMFIDGMHRSNIKCSF